MDEKPVGVIRKASIIRQTLHSRVLYLSTRIPSPTRHQLLSPIDFYITHLPVSRFVSKPLASLRLTSISSPFAGGFVEYRAGTRRAGEKKQKRKRMVNDSIAKRKR